jgi:hypothetical protein
MIFSFTPRFSEVTTNKLKRESRFNGFSYRFTLLK